MISDVSDLLRRLSEVGTNVRMNEAGGIRLTGRQPSPEMLDELREAKVVVLKVLRLEKRLDFGWEECQAETDPTIRGRYEDDWIELLHEYERCFGSRAS